LKANIFSYLLSHFYSAIIHNIHLQKRQRVLSLQTPPSVTRVPENVDFRL